MDVFFTGIIVLLAMVFIFYLVFFGFVYYWHLKTETYIIIPFIFAFELLVRGAIIVTIVALILNYYPSVISQLNL